MNLMKSRLWKWRWPLLFFVSISLRILYLAFLENPLLVHDEVSYLKTARLLAERGQFMFDSQVPNAYGTPGYPVFMAFFIYLFGDTPLALNAIRAAQSFLSLSMIPLVFFLSIRMGMKSAPSFWAAAAIGLYGPFIWAGASFLTEMVFAFLLLSATLSLLRAYQEDEFRWFFISGLIYGALLMVRPTPALFLPIPFLLMVFWTRQDRYPNLWLSLAQVIRQGLVFSLGLLLVVSPWWIRNYNLYDKFIPFSTAGGNTYLAGMHPYMQGWHDTAKTLPQASEFPNDEAYDEFIYKKSHEVARTEWQKDPWGYAGWFTLGKWKWMWYHTWHESFRLDNLQQPLAFVFFLQRILHKPLIFLGWLGLFWALPRRYLAIASLSVIYITAIHSVYLPEPRYAFPYLPFLFITASYLTDNVRNYYA